MDRSYDQKECRNNSKRVLIVSVRILIIQQKRHLCGNLKAQEEVMAGQGTPGVAQYSKV